MLCSVKCQAAHEFDSPVLLSLVTRSFAVYPLTSDEPSTDQMSWPAMVLFHEKKILLKNHLTISLLDQNAYRIVLTRLPSDSALLV